MALRHFWYPGLNADIRNQIRACVVCINKDLKVRTKAGAYVPGTNGFPGQTLYVDLVQMNKSPEGYQYILSMEDGFSRFNSLALLKSKRSEEVIQGLLEHFISRMPADHSLRQGQRIHEPAAGKVVGPAGGGTHLFTSLQPPVQQCGEVSPHPAGPLPDVDIH